MRVVAVVPVQAFSEGKSRLAKVFSPAERTALIERMLGRVLKALRGARLIDGVVVVSPELDVGLPDDVEVLRDKGRGLNEAVSFAVQTLADRYDAAIVVAADIPNVTSEEIDSLVSRATDHDVVVVPDRRGEGTNALWMKFSSNFSTQYGSMSAARHLESARRLSLRSARVELPGLSHDIDVPDDLRDGLEFDKE